jgi:serralysin
MRGRGIFSCNINCTRTDEDDHLIGTSNQSQIKGLMGADLIEGNRGHDRIYGGDDRDELYEDDGHDYVGGGWNRDHIDRGPGHDLVVARDGYKDLVECGNGRRDRIYYDSSMC